MLKDGQAEALRDAGLDYYNHNLDTAPEFYGEIITTRDYDDRLDTLERVRDAGINVCCGGIVGMGETRAQRAGLVAQLANLDPYPGVGADQPPGAGRGHAAARRAARRSRARSARVRAHDRGRAHHDAEGDGAPVRRPPRAGRRRAGAVLPRRRQLDLLRRPAAHHRQSRRRRRPRAVRPAGARAARRDADAIAGLADRSRSRSAATPGSRARAARSTRRRAQRVAVDGRELLSFASNDYLGLANDPALVAAARDGRARWGVGAGASHLVCGHTAPHEALERELAAFVAPCAGARALSFSSGYLANLAILTALAGRDDAIFADRLNHACLNDGALLVARAARPLRAWRRRRAVAARSRPRRRARKLIATDAVFSMDGDVAPLPRLLALAEAHDAWLVVDDAHGFGVLGEGRGSARALRPRVRAHRLHGHARQGGRRGRRVRGRASGGDRHARADGAPVRLHDGGAAAARGRACARRSR